MATWIVSIIYLVAAFVFSLVIWMVVKETAEQLLTLDQVAEYLNVDKATVYRLIAQKQFPAFKVGGQWRFKGKMIEAWLTKNLNVQ